MGMINVVYLYSRLQPSVITIINELVKMQNINVYVFYWDNSAYSAYKPPEIDNVKYFKKSDYDNSTLYKNVANLNPHILYVSGWMDKTYLSVCKNLRRKCKIPIIAGSDTKWMGGKQWINVIISPWLQRKCFSHIQVAGVWQYEYARRLGFSKNQILMHNLSADVALFNKVDIESKADNYPKRFIYSGSLIPLKGLRFLVEAWKKIKNKNGWELMLIGNGPEKDHLLIEDDIKIIDFSSQDQLCYHLQNSGCFILPSLREQWGVVLHEAASAGLPILASDICGAVPYFVLNNYNGITFRPGSAEQIKMTLEKIINASEDDLLEMAYNSRKLSIKITPEIVARTLLSVLQDKK